MIESSVYVHHTRTWTLADGGDVAADRSSIGQGVRVADGLLVISSSRAPQSETWPVGHPEWPYNELP
jgi:hypothetical protein